MIQYEEQKAMDLLACPPDYQFQVCDTMKHHGYFSIDNQRAFSSVAMMNKQTDPRRSDRDVSSAHPSFIIHHSSFIRPQVKLTRTVEKNHSS